VRELREDARALNEFAWSLLTEDPFAGRFARLARRASERSNELTHFGEWRYLDTLALAEFESGAVEEAIAHQEKALELARREGDDEGARSVAGRLERFRAGRR
jgi:hypothetical protein